MGGHGGLNILPQKSWNVYNFDNRERVKRDEEAAAREEQLRQQKARQAELEFKLEKLREISQSKRKRVEQQGAEGRNLEEGAEGAGAIVVREASGSIEGRLEETDGAGAEKPQHINFFAEFEARALAEGHGRLQDREKGRRGEERERGRESSRKERNAGKGVEKVDGKPTGDPVNENYRLGHGVVDKNGKKPWYAYKTFMAQRTQDEQESPNTKLQITGGLDHKRGKSKRKTVEELRAERLRREQQEKDKARKLVVAKAGRSSTGYDCLPNGRAPQYHGSFGNAR